jgi:mannan endo-1,4-beta-mannosidase
VTAIRAAATAAILTLAVSYFALQADTLAGKHRRVYWGGWIGDQLTGTAAPYDMNAVSKFQRLTGKGLSLVEFAQPFAGCGGSCFYDFPTTEMKKVRRYGAIPFLSWSSAAIGTHPVNQPNFQLSDVIAGRYDSHIRRWARSAESWGHPFFLRFNWEMNGDWFSWSEGVNGNRRGQFVTAWRHVHRIFTSVGARNATWVWCPLAMPSNTVRKLRRLYPGNRYVDWTCLDAYNWGATPVNPHPWRSFNRLLKRDYRRVVRRIAPRKPMVLAEIASNSRGGDKAVWIRKMFRALPRYRKVHGLIWFDVFDRNIDWPLETSRRATRAFKRGIRRHRYARNTFSNIRSRPIRPPR